MGAYSDAVLADGAVQYWRLNEASGTTATDVVGGKTGTIGAGVTLGVSGALADGDKAMTFADLATSQVRSTQTYAVPKTGFTIEAWARPTANPVLGQLWSTGQFVEGALGFYLASNQQVRLTWTLGTPATIATATAAFALDGSWLHIVATVSGTTTRLYINGVDKTSGAGAQTPYAGAFPLRNIGLGYDPDSNDSRFIGDLDEIAVYHTVLTPTQIAAHYALRTAVPAVPSTATARFGARYCWGWARG